MVTDNEVCNERAQFCLQVIEKDAASDLHFPFCLPSAAPHQWSLVGQNSLL